MSKTVEDIGTLKINLLSQAQYDAEKAGGRLADDELYLTPSSGTGVSDVEVNGSSVVSGGVAEITINDIPSGGTAGQVLTKESGTDYDVSWEDPSGGTITDVTVDGTSIVDNGVAELETVTQLRDGLMTATDKQKLDGIASGAEVNVQSDWNEADNTKDDYIKNKPTIPTVNDATLTIQKNGSTVNTFTANASSNVTANITVPTDTSDLTNGAGYITGYTETDPTVPSWAKQVSKPSYTFSEIGSKPTTISGYGITDAKIASGTITLGSDTITPLTSFTETDPTVPSWAKQASKPTYTASEVGALPDNTTIPSKTSDLVNDSGFITGVTSTSTPTASTIAEFDSSAHMNSADMSAQDVSDFVDDLTYTSEVADVVADMVDYIVAQGTDGIWTYRKWNSGIAECWGNYATESIAVARAFGSLYTHTSAVGGVSYPFAFTSPPYEVETMTSSNAWLMYQDSQTATKSKTFWITRPTSVSTASSYVIHIYAKGTWK